MWESEISGLFNIVTYWCIAPLPRLGYLILGAGKVRFCIWGEMRNLGQLEICWDKLRFYGAK